METLTQKFGAGLASKYSRRGFIGFAGKAALGMALWLNGSSLAYATHCACGCDVVNPRCPCRGCGAECTNCAGGGGCGTGCSSSNTWNCCINGCVMTCTECCCNETQCHCFTFVGQSCGSPNCPFAPVRTIPSSERPDALVR